MKMLSKELIKSTVIELLRRAETQLPSDVKEALEKAYKSEEIEIAKLQIKNILDNIALAEKLKLPICQDTGTLIFYVTNPTEKIEIAIQEAVKEATKLIPLRPNTVEPLTRKNPGDNLGERLPQINYSFSPANFMEITVLPKGSGAENMSRLAMLLPTQGLKGIKEFVLETVVRAGSKPCPPTILGIGIGGSADIAPKLAKEALLRPINQRHRDKEIAELENKLYEAINLLGIGPMGVGGKTTCLGVNIEYAYCHSASLPVAVNMQCWCARRATTRIYGANRVEYV